MISGFALAALAVTSAQPAEGLSLLIGSDKELSTSVRLVETDSSVRFEFSGPEFVAPMISIDINRNGVVDRNVDFQVGVEPGKAPCLSYMLSETSSSTCKKLDDKATVAQNRSDQGMVTTISFPKRIISGDGFGFGFAIRLWSVTGRYGTSVAGGDYQFGGKLSLVSDSPNFTGQKKPNIPAPMLPALRRYQGCVNKTLDALAPLNRTMGAQIRALPASCAGERSIAVDEGVNAMIAAGTQKDEATELMLSYLDGYDEQFSELAEKLEKAGN